MNPEAIIQNDIRVALSAHGCLMIRTNTGTVKTVDGRMFTAGPPNGWADLSGYRKADGRFIAIEVKTQNGRLRPDQKKMAALYAQSPIIYGVCRSAEDAIKLVDSVPIIKEGES